MNAQRLLQHFNRIAEAPDAIPCLRQFILELAVRGKLADHDPKDESASELLKRILAEKEGRIRAEQMKKQEPLPQVRPDEAWFAVPASWSWVRLGTITQVLMGQSPPGETYNKTGEGIPLINGPVEFTEGPFGKTIVNQYTTAPTNLCEEGDLLLCVRGSTTGRTNIAGFRACIGRGVAAIRPFFADQYVRLFIWRLRASIIAMGRGIAFPSVSRRQIEELPVPLPPLSEQHRIVAKVDELMALCDRLEAAKAERETRRDRLAAASLNRLNNGADAESFREHARFHLGQLPRLTTRPEHIQQLRQTILNLAVRGKLVAQDPNEEPAAELLSRIHVENCRLRDIRGIRHQKSVEPNESFEVDTEIPKSWVHAYLQDLAYQITDGTHLTPKYTDEGKPFLSAQNVKPFRFMPNRHRFVSKTDFERYRANRKPERGDVLLTRVGAGIGEAAVLDSDFEFAFYVSLCLVKIPMTHLLPDYLVLWLNSPEGRHSAATRTYGKGASQGNLNLALIRTFRIPLPPVAEQHRIVAKVEEVLTLCDGLEAQLNTAATAGTEFLEATIAEALARPQLDRSLLGEQTWATNA